MYICRKYKQLKVFRLVKEKGTTINYSNAKLSYLFGHRNIFNLTLSLNKFLCLVHAFLWQYIFVNKLQQNGWTGQMRKTVVWIFCHNLQSPIVVSNSILKYRKVGIARYITHTNLDGNTTKQQQSKFLPKNSIPIKQYQKTFFTNSLLHTCLSTIVAKKTSWYSAFSLASVRNTVVSYKPKSKIEIVFFTYFPPQVLYLYWLIKYLITRKSLINMSKLLTDFYRILWVETLNDMLSGKSSKSSSIDLNLTKNLSILDNHELCLYVVLVSMPHFGDSNFSEELRIWTYGL